MVKIITAALLFLVVLAVVGCASKPWDECATDAEAAYFDTQSDIFAELRDLTLRVGEFASEAGEDNSVVRDREWLASVRQLPEDSGALLERVEAMDPPQSVADLHSQMTTVVTLFDSAMVLFVHGAETDSGAPVRQAQQLMTDGTTFVDTMHERTENFCK